MRTRNLLAVGIAAGSLAFNVTGALGAHADQSAYIVPDTGKPTENSDVNSDSSCDTPDQVDVQATGDFDGNANNVHVDGCIYDADGGFLDTTVSFQTDGVGGIAACPDADGDGPKTATVSDPDNDGINEICTHTGYEDANQQYHVRVLSETVGAQTVTMCTDPETNGCDDADPAGVSAVEISYTSTLPSTGGGLILVGGLALAGAGALGFRKR